MEDFDKKLRNTEEWSGWERRATHKHTLVHEGRRYPVKQVIRMATGATDFSGGDEANSYVRRRGFSVVPLRDEETEGNGLSIREGLEEILAGYASARANEPLGGNELWKTFKAVTNAIEATSAVIKRPTLRVKASMGQGKDTVKHKKFLTYRGGLLRLLQSGTSVNVGWRLPGRVYAPGAERSSIWSAARRHPSGSDGA
jgi:hypothetical protein